MTSEAFLGLPIIDKVDLDLKKDRLKVKKIFEDEVNRLKEGGGKGTRKVSILVGEGNRFDKVVVCTTSAKYFEKMLAATDEGQIKQKAVFDKIKCFLFDV